MTPEIHTLRFGTADWLDACAPTLDAYAARHGVALHIWDDTDRGYPCVKFCEYDMLKKFLDGGNSHMIYIDADVLIHPLAPLPDLTEGLSMASCVLHREHDNHWRKWCEEHFKVTPEGFDYSNAGVWICDRESAKQLLVYFKPPFIEYFQDQHFFNYAVYRATQDGMKFNRLPNEWNQSNRVAERPDPTWFTHFWGDEKDREIAEIA